VPDELRESLNEPLSVAWSVVNYGTGDMVIAFIRELVQHFSATDVELRLAVGDNSPVTELSHEMLIEACGGTAFSFVPDPSNPGYLPGALHALDELDGPTPDWVVISNADLEFRSPPVGWFQELRQRYDATELICVAPQVTCLGTGSHLNPHLASRPSRWSVLIRWALTRSKIGLNMMERRSRASRTRAAGLQQTQLVTTDSKIYAAHGSIWVMTGRALKAMRPEIDGTPLYAEEFAIAEACRRADIPIWFKPSFTIAHEPHASTGQVSGHQRARRWSTAYSHIARHFFPRIPVLGREISA